MKFSQYNNLVEFENKYILFNALSYRFLYLEPILADLLKEHIDKGTPHLLDKIHPDFHEALNSNGFIVEDAYDEYEKVKQLIKGINNNDENYRLIINPTVDCNFSCWYCYENHSLSTQMSEETMRRILLLIQHLASDARLKRFQLSFFGGEPLLYYSKVVLPLAEYTHNLLKQYNKSFFFDITSNGYLLNRERLETLANWGLGSCQITLDGNKQEHDKTRFLGNKKGSYDRIIENIKIAVRLGIEIVLRINYTAQNLVGLSNIFCNFEDLTQEERKKITLSMNKVWQEKEVELGESVKLFKKSAEVFGFKLPAAWLSDRVRNSCYADKQNEAVVNYNGHVYKCNARDFTDESKEGILDEQGKISWNDTHQIRCNSVLTNKNCKNCSVFPICGGGCSQTAFENKNKSYCIHKNKDAIHEQIIELFLSECNQKVI